MVLMPGLCAAGPPGQVSAIAGKKDGMKQGTLGGILKELGYTEDQVCGGLSAGPSHCVAYLFVLLATGLQVLRRSMRCENVTIDACIRTYTALYTGIRPLLQER